MNFTYFVENFLGFIYFFVHIRFINSQNIINYKTSYDILSCTIYYHVYLYISVASMSTEATGRQVGK